MSSKNYNKDNGFLKKLILIGPISSPRGGEAFAFQMLIDFLSKDKAINQIIIDKLYKQGNKIRRYINPIRVILITLVSLLTKSDGIYLTSGQSLGGIIRDCCVVCIGKWFRVPVILHLHGGGHINVYLRYNLFVKKILKHFYQRVDVIIILSESLREQVSFIKDRSIIKEVYNSYSNDAPQVQNIEEVYHHQQKESFLKLLYLSHVLPSKGLFDVLEALLIVKEKNIPFKFNFCGSIISEGGLSVNDIKILIDGYKKKFDNNTIVFHGFVSGSEKWDLLFKNDIFLLPTRFYAEGQPISIIEAMYAGCVVIATKYRGIPDLIEEKKNGFFVRSKDPKAIAERIIWLWENQNILKEMSIRNHEKAKKYFSPDRFLTQMEVIFKETFDLSVDIKRVNNLAISQIF